MPKVEYWLTDEENDRFLAITKLTVADGQSRDRWRRWADECAGHYHDDRCGFEAQWPVRISIRHGEEVRHFEVDRRIRPDFVVSELGAP